MTAISFRTPAAIASAGAAIAAVVTVGMAPTAYAVPAWGAVVTGSDGHWGISYGKENAQQAINSANSACGSGCGTTVTFMNNCAAIARDGNSLYSDFGNTRADAEQRVQSKHPGSVLVTWACNNPPGSGPTSWQG